MENEEPLTFDAQHKLDKDIRAFVDSWRYHGPMDNYQLEKMIYFDDEDDEKFRRIFEEYKQLIDGLFEQFRVYKSISLANFVQARKKLLNKHDNFYNLDQPEHFDKFKHVMFSRANHYRIRRIQAKITKEGRLTTPAVEKNSRNYYPYGELKRIGKGGFGEVWTVRDESGKKYIAKKVRCDKLEYRTLCEWSELLYLRHDNIVNAEECFFDPKNKLMIIIMEYCAFGDIAHLIRFQQMTYKRFPENDILKVVVMAAEALSYAHEQNTNHLDIKPQNFFITEEGQLKLGDFGVSIDRRRLEQVYGPEDMAGEVGTYPYMAPELFHGEEPTFKCDMWSLGCTLYEICMLKPAFERPNKLALSQIIVRRKFDNIDGPYSENLKNLIYKLMANDPDERPESWEILEMDFIRRFQEEDSNKVFTLELPQGQLSKSGRRIIAPGTEFSPTSSPVPSQKAASQQRAIDQTCNMAALLSQARKKSSKMECNDSSDWDSFESLQRGSTIGQRSSCSSLNRDREGAADISVDLASSVDSRKQMKKIGAGDVKALPLVIMTAFPEFQKDKDAEEAGEVVTERPLNGSLALAIQVCDEETAIPIRPGLQEDTGDSWFCRCNCLRKRSYNKH